jgi:uroporphyrinogen-III decarboxylase
MGCEVIFGDAMEAVPVIGKRILTGVGEVNKLTQVDVEKAGRMPLVLEVAEQVVEKLGDEIFVRGSISGPYSMAAELVGMEKLMIASIAQAEAVERLLAFCTKVAIDYGKAFLARGVEVCIFDSQTAPPLMSPETYGKLVLPHNQKIISSLKNAGAKFIEYVVGGDTGVNVKNIFATGADILLSDFSSDLKVCVEQAKGRPCLIRRNISPALVEYGDESEIISQTRQITQLTKINQQIMLGTGVLSYNTSSERVLLVKNTYIEEFTN